MKLTILGNTPSQKNNKQIFVNSKTGKPFITSNQRVKTWHKSAYAQLKEQWQGFEMTDYPITLTVIFYRDSIRKYDLDNAYSSVADALTLAGVIEDDNVNFVECVQLQHGGKDATNPRAEIYFDE
jgi:Holliday junction resolvase RusA-like endonuclease